MPTVTMKLIRPKKIDIELMLSMLADGVQEEGEKEQKEYEKTTRTWRNKPEHEMSMSQTKAEIKATNLTDDRIYFFIHEGTRVRYAVLSKDWQSKTTPGIINSRAGRGKVLFVSKKHPRPGIEARGWTDIIIRNRKGPFKTAMQRRMNDIAKATNARGQA